MDERLKMPPVRDFGFYQRRKHDKWSAVPLPYPALEGPVADSHAHVHMLPDPAWELARCAANGVDYVCMITDPAEDGPRPFDELDAWVEGAAAHLAEQRAARRAAAEADAASAGGEAQGTFRAPDVRIAVGVHPHNARLYDENIEKVLLGRLGDRRVVALGEIGLDYHYDLSPRPVQRQVFRRQLELAKEAGLPVALHLRSGEDPDSDAHAEAFGILSEVGFPQAGTLVHCCALAPDDLRPWVEAGCAIAYGGAMTFKKADAAREGAKLVPVDQLLLETDTPYMAPDPMRGTACTPAHVIFTAALLAEVRGVAPGEDRRRFLQQLHDNTLAFYQPR